MFHGIITDSMVSSETDWNAPVYVNPAACITLAISDSPKGPFKPAQVYDSSTYSQSSLVRYIWPKDDSSIKSDSAIGYSGCYNRGNGVWTTGFGCIDPEFIYDIATGNLVEYSVGSNTCYGVLYGSWKGGLAVIYVDAQTFKPVCTVAGTSSYDKKSYSVGEEMDAPVDSISGNFGTKIIGGNGTAYEGAQLVYNSETKRYYIFTSMGELTYEYRVGVGRSAEVTTFTPSSMPTEFLDASGRNMNAVVDTTEQTLYYHNVGSKIIGAQCLSGEYGFTSPGGLSVFRNSKGQILFCNHARTNYVGSGNFMLQVHQLFFNSKGWPVLNQNDFYGDYAGYTSGGTEELSALTVSEIAGTYDTILTERSNTTASVTTVDKNSKSISASDGVATASKSMILYTNGFIGGDNYGGTWALSDDGYSVTINLTDTSGTSLGSFYGYALHAVDFARKSGYRRTITFSTLCSNTSASEAGEYFWGNRKSGTSATSLNTTLFTTKSTVIPAAPVSVHFVAEAGTFTVTSSDGKYTNKSLTGTDWWVEGNGATDAVTLNSGSSLTYTFTVSAAGADCLVEAYDSEGKYLSTTSQQTAWGDLSPSNSGSQTLGVLKVNCTYEVEVSYKNSVITITYSRVK